MKPVELKEIAFPVCARRCEVVDYLGVGECESVCAFKFVEEMETGVNDEKSGRDSVGS